MNRYCRLGILSLALVSLTPKSARAQQPGPRHFTLATGLVGTNDRKFRTIVAPTLDVTYDWRIAASRSAAAFVGAYAGTSLGFPTGDQCLPNGRRGCQITIPIMGFVGAQVGGLVQSRHFGLALSSGPGLFVVQGRGQYAYVNPSTGETSLRNYPSTNQSGVLSRAEVFLRISPRFALGLSGNLRSINNVYGDHVTISGGSFGMRLQ